jgi:hypothetical protein
MSSIFPSRSTAVSLTADRTIKLAAFVFTTVLLAFPAQAQFRVQPQTPVQTPAQTSAAAQSNGWPSQSPDLAALRASSSPAERKLSFNLFLISRNARHASIGTFASSLDSKDLNPDGTVTVEVNAYLSPSLMASPVMASIVRENGAIPLPAYVSDHLYVRVRQSQLLELAANPNVLAIRETDKVVPANTMAAASQPPVNPASR